MTLSSAQSVGSSACSSLALSEARRCLRFGTPFPVACVWTGRCLAIASQQLTCSHLVVQVRVCRSWVLHINGHRVDLAPISILPLLVGERYGA